MNKDQEAFYEWFNEPMYGSGYNATSRKEFAASTGAKVEDLAWAFCSGRMSLRQEQHNEGK